MNYRKTRHFVANYCYKIYALSWTNSIKKKYLNGQILFSRTLIMSTIMMRRHLHEELCIRRLCRGRLLHLPPPHCCDGTPTPGEEGERRRRRRRRVGEEEKGGARVQSTFFNPIRQTVTVMKPRPLPGLARHTIPHSPGPGRGPGPRDMALKWSRHKTDIRASRLIPWKLTAMPGLTEGGP